MSRACRTILSAIVLAAGAAAVGAEARAMDSRPSERVHFVGGSPYARAQVENALAASSFDWTPLHDRVVVHIGRFDSAATPGHVWLNADLMRAGRFSWGVVLHEYGHQVDFLLLEPAQRDRFHSLLGGEEWFPVTPSLPHDAYGCERFASTFAWSYWPSPANSMKPNGPGDESSAMRPRQFRLVLDEVLSP